MRIFLESEKTNTRISFEELGRMIGHRWQSLDEDGRKKYQELAEKDIIRYQNEIFVFNKNMCQKSTRRVSKSPNSLEPNFEECFSSSKHSVFPSVCHIARTVTEDDSSHPSFEASVKSTSMPSPQTFLTEKEVLNQDVHDASHHDYKARLFKPKTIMKLPPVIMPYSSYPWPSSQFMDHNCAASTYYPFDSGWDGADACSKQSTSMDTDFKEWNRLYQYPGTGYDWRIVSSREIVPSFQPLSNGGFFFPPRGTVSIPDPKTNSERIYNVDYKCFRMTRKEFDTYLERCRQSSHDHGKAKMKIHNQIPRAPTPPGIEIRDVTKDW